MADFQSLADAINEMKEELSGIGSEQVTFLDSTESLSNQMLVVQREMLQELQSIREGLNLEKIADALKPAPDPFGKAQQTETTREGDTGQDTTGQQVPDIEPVKDKKGMSLLKTMGIAALVAGGGAILAALGGFLDFDAEGVKKNIKTLLSISDDVGGKAEFFLEGGTFFLAMSGIGVGLAVFGAGSAIAGLSDSLNKYVGNEAWASSIKKNVLTLLSIKDEAGGNLDFLADSGTFVIAMTAIGTGLAVFGAGSAIGGVSDALTSLMKPDWASSINKNVLTLLSIKDDAGGNLDFLADGGTFMVAMASIGAGLAVFGAGSTVAGAADAITDFIKPDFAQSIKDNVLTLLSIKDEAGGNLEFLKSGGTFFVAMTALSAGLVAFAVGEAAASTAQAISSFSGENFAQQIKDNVITLLSISKLDGIGMDTAGFVAVMGGLSAGLLAFAVGQTGASVADALSRFMTGKDKFSTAIVDNVKELMTIYDIPVIKDGSATGETFAELMSGIGRGLNAFAGGQLGSALKGVGTSILNFLTGNESPIEEMVKLADNAKDLDTASDAIEKLATSLSVISAMKFDGSNLNFKAFAKDLKESVPIIEAAIMGDDGGFFGTKIEGLASSNIKYEDAVKNIKMLREALVAMPRTAGLQTSQATNTAEGGTGNNTIVAPTVVDASVNDSSQPVTTITGRDSFNQPSYAQYV